MIHNHTNKLKEMEEMKVAHTPLHIAAEAGNTKVALELLSLMPSLGRKLDERGFSPLHLAREKNHLDTARSMAGFDNQLLMRRHQVSSVLSVKDLDGKRSFTLQLNLVVYRFASLKQQHSMCASTCRAFYYLSAELTLEMRNAILVVATLIVAGTYQGVLQPPGGVYPPASPSNATITSATHETLLTSQYHMGRRLGAINGSLEKQREAGQMVMEKAYYRFFMPSNSFVLSAVIMIFVVPGTPVFLLLHSCLVFMCISYLLALDAISYYSGISHKIFYMALYAIVGAYIVKLLYYPFKALLVDADWWLRGLSVKFANYSTSATGGFPKAILNKLDKIKKQHMVLRLPSTN
ncbi:hypothetical protein SASPL_150730 [Salvia splendens]|uniref:PGG domain-containing protein n=1 Tax=Salvia splendens TaxID=180675 RepID=A0A8X8W6I7_SALSN|nr:hypothetical protein SASPL_150730 [Salvia splendens]